MSHVIRVHRTKVISTARYIASSFVWHGKKPLEIYIQVKFKFNNKKSFFISCRMLMLKLAPEKKVKIECVLKCEYSEEHKIVKKCSSRIHTLRCDDLSLQQYIKMEHWIVFVSRSLARNTIVNEYNAWSIFSACTEDLFSSSSFSLSNSIFRGEQ